MKLATREALRARSSSVQLAAIDTAFDQALESATIQLAGLLGTTGFGRGEHEDVFWVDSYARPWLGTAAPLALSRGFVATEVPVVVKSADRSSGSPLKIVDDRISVSHRAGLLRVDAAIDQRYCWVSYTAGFEAQADRPDVYAGVPDEVAEMALQLALNAYYQGVDSGEASSSNRKGLSPYFDELVVAARRSFTWAIQPLP